MTDLELIKDVLAEAEDIPFRDFAKADAMVRRAEMAIRRAFGPNSIHLRSLSAISFTENQDRGVYWDPSTIWTRGHAQLKNLLRIAVEEFSLPATDTSPPGRQERSPNGRVFVVHGHDESMKQQVARTLERLHLTPVVLHEQPSKGRTIIEKFTDYSDVGFAVVLLSPDDLAYPRDGAASSVRPRARQNVVLELGYFLGKLGRERVVALFREVPDFELPSDYSGVVLVPFDDRGRWAIDLVRELKSGGYTVDANDLP